MTNGRKGLHIYAIANKNGVFNILGFCGRKYRLEIARSKPVRAVYHSPVIAVGPKDLAVRWQLSLPAILTIRAVIGTETTTGSLLEEREIIVRSSGERARVFPIRKGVFSIAKSDEFLADTKGIEILVTAKSAAEYSLVKGGYLELRDGDQTHTLLLELKRKGFLNVSISGLDVKSTARVWLLSAAGDVLARQPAGRRAEVLAAKYRVLAWSPGYIFERANVEVKKGREERLTIALKRAPQLKGKVVDGDGAPIGGARVGLRYASADMIRSQEVVTLKDGSFTLPVEGSGGAALRVMSMLHGGRVIALPADVDRAATVGDIRLCVPAQVTAKGVLEPEAAVASKGASDWSAMWVSREYPKSVVAFVRVRNGAIKARLQPGQYLGYIFCGGECVRMESLDCTVKAAGESVALGQYRLTVKTWATKVPLSRLDMR